MQAATLNYIPKVGEFFVKYVSAHLAGFYSWTCTFIHILSHQIRVGSNPGRDTCVLEQDTSL